MKVSVLLFVTLAVIAIVYVEAAPVEDTDSLAVYGADLAETYCGEMNNQGAEDGSEPSPKKGKGKKGKKGKKDKKDKKGEDESAE